MCLFLNSPQLLGFSVSNQLLICIILGPIQVLRLSSTTIIARSAVLRVRLNRNQALGRHDAGSIESGASHFSNLMVYTNRQLRH